MVSSDTVFGAANLQFTDFTIIGGVTLNIPSGTVIRCTGTFTNNGQVKVQVGAVGGDLSGNVPTVGTWSTSPADPGASLRAAGSGEWGDSTSIRNGGFGGTELSIFQARQVRSPGPKAGGAGGGTGTGSAGAGGGSLVVLARTAIVNAGAGIIADGANSAASGGGGGAGGIVILASAGSITTNTAPISVKGGAGGANNSAVGPGGGGGGGFAHLMAPVVTTTTSTFVTDGGLAGTNSVTMTAPARGGGGGGGACAGRGGTGGSAGAGPSPGAGPGEDGIQGYVLVDQFDPTSLF